MDPLSITTGSIALATVAFQIASVINSGIKTVKDVDFTLEAFHGEVTALANALNLVGKALQGPRLKHLDEESLRSDGQVSEVLRGLQAILNNCKVTLTKLNEIVQTASKTSRKSIFSRTTIALQLNLKSSDIALLRTQIQTYHTAMQMVFSMLNVSILLTQNSSVATSVPAGQTQGLQDDDSVRHNKVQDSEPSNADIVYREKLSNLRHHTMLSQTTLSRAGTIYGTETGSIADSDVMTTPRRGSFLRASSGKYRSLETWIGNGNTVNPEDSFGATISGKRLVLALQRLGEEKYSDAEQLLKTSISSVNLSNDQVYEASLALAVCHMGRGKYGDARDMIRELLESKNISPEQESHLNSCIIEIQSELALKLKEQKQYQEASQMIIELLQAKDVTESQTAHLNHELAEIYLKESKTEEALPHATKACEIWHDQQNDRLYYNSCRLLARLHLSMHNEAEASIYYDEIPQEYRYGGRVTVTRISTFTYPAKSQSKILFHPQGKLLIAGHKGTADDKAWSVPDYMISSWELTDNTASIAGRNLIGTHEGEIRSIAFTVDGQRLISVCGRRIKIWNTSQEFSVLEKKHNDRTIKCFAISPDSSTLVLAFESGKVCQWDLIHQRYSTSRCADLTKGIESLSFAPNGKILAATIRGDSRLKESAVKLLSFPSYETIAVLGGVSLLSFSSDGSNLACICKNNIQIWSVRMLHITRTLKQAIRTSEVPERISFSPDGNILAVSSSSRILKLLDSNTGKILQVMEIDTSTPEFCFSPDGTLLAAQLKHGEIGIHKLEYY